MSRITINISLIVDHMAKLDEIAFKGLASNGRSQSLEYVLDKAIEEFIKKYKK